MILNDVPVKSVLGVGTYIFLPSERLMVGIVFREKPASLAPADLLVDVESVFAEDLVFDIELVAIERDRRLFMWSLVIHPP